MSQAAPIFDDQYTGPRWRYGLPSRHAIHYLGSPAGPWILYSERRSDDPGFPFGTMDFPRELPEDVARGLDLVLVATFEGVIGQ